MKNSIKTLVAVASLILCGCSNLEEDPKSILSPDGFFKSYQDVEAAMFGVYGRMASDNAWGGEWTQALVLLSDMVDIGNSGTGQHNFELNEFRSTPEQYYSGLIWRRGYDIINAANTVIEGAHEVDIEEGLKLKLEAEARALRAFAYFNIVRLFGDLPYFDRPVTDIESSLEMTRTSEDDIYANIIADLEFAFVDGRLPNVYSGGARSRVTRGTAGTMLASVHLTLGDYQEAYDYAKFVIDNKDIYEYGLVPNYKDLFDPNNHDGIVEHIFAVDFLLGVRHSDNDDTMSPLTGIAGSGGGWSIIVPSMDVYDDWDDRDYRKTASFDTVSVRGVHYTEFPQAKRPHISKYNSFAMSEGNGRRSDYNYPLYRYAEVLLIAAEALNEVSGPTAEAQGYVNEVRERARNWPDYVATFPLDVDPAGQTTDSFRDIVLEERRVELAFEYKRWFDIKRRNLGDEVFKGPNSLEPQPNFDASKSYLLPIPQRERDINPNITQNPGY